MFWRLIDSLFGIVGFAILWVVRGEVSHLKSAKVGNQ